MGRWPLIKEVYKYHIETVVSAVKKKHRVSMGESIEGTQLGSMGTGMASLTLTFELGCDICVGTRGGDRR